eukprot:213743_1
MLPLVLAGCDTFVAYPPSTPEGMVVFGKNSDRPAGEAQSIRQYPSKRRNNENDMLQCTYISIPQIEKTNAVLLSQIDWMWGAEMGANDCGVIIGNEAVWTKEEIKQGNDALLGMDLVRLGLERGSTARECLDVITQLLNKHGQGGACAENDPSFTYHNSFLIVDYNEAYVLETAGKHWVAEKITKGARNISNCLTIRTKFDLCSKNLKQYAKSKGLWMDDGKEEFDFAKCFSNDDGEPNSRQICGQTLLQQHYNKNSLDYKAMINILRDDDSGICMHGAFETTASMVSELRGQNPNSAMHWMTGKSYPCKAEFVLQHMYTSPSIVATLDECIEFVQNSKF